MRTKICDISKILGIDMLYIRKEQDLYDKGAVLEFDRKFANKRSYWVLEIDFNSYYPKAVMINKDNKYPP